MIPDRITRAHLLQALAHIDTHGVPRGRASRHYELLHDHIRYPPKYAVALAAELATGSQLPSDTFGGGKETNDFLRRLGFTIVRKGDSPQPLRVAVISLRAAGARVEKRALRQAVAAARNDYDGRLLCLFSGVSSHWSSNPDAFRTLLQRHRASALAELSFPEGARYVGLDASLTDFLPQRVRQRLAGGSEATRHPERVAQILAECEPGGPRRFPLEGLQVGVIVCGENNLLRSCQSEGNACKGIRHHPGVPLLPGTDIVLNGAHTIMGNWDKINKRFAWISQHHRLLAYTTNNTNKRAWGTALRVFYNGQRVADGNGIRIDNGHKWPFVPQLVASNDWRLVLLDRFTPPLRPGTP